jgi:hypothetical protein
MAEAIATNMGRAAVAARSPQDHDHFRSERSEVMDVIAHLSLARERTENR